MRNLIFTSYAWEDYLYWQTENRKILKRINQLIKDIERNGYKGIGKPEPLRGDLSDWHKPFMSKGYFTKPLINGTFHIQHDS